MTDERERAEFVVLQHDSWPNGYRFGFRFGLEVGLMIAAPFIVFTVVTIVRWVIA